MEARRQRPIELVPQALGRHGVLADERGAGDLAHGRGDDLFFRDRGHATADKAGIGFDLGYDQRQADRLA